VPYLGPILDMEGVARLLRITPARFAEIRAELEAMGFPQPLQPLDRWLREPIERWIADQAAKGTMREGLKWG
jgi:hypothetical protein